MKIENQSNYIVSFGNYRSNIKRFYTIPIYVTVYFRWRLSGRKCSIKIKISEYVAISSCSFIVLIKEEKADFWKSENMSIELSRLQSVEYGCPNDIEWLYADYIYQVCVLLVLRNKAWDKRKHLFIIMMIMMRIFHWILTKTCISLHIQ